MIKLEIAKKLKELFPDIDIIDEQMEQNRPKPCFLILQQSVSPFNHLGGWMLIKERYNVIYFPKDLINPEAENHEIKTKLMTGFKSLGGYRVSGLYMNSWNTNELKIYFNINYRLAPIDDGTKMMEYEGGTYVKED